MSAVAAISIPHALGTGVRFWTLLELSIFPENALDMCPGCGHAVGNGCEGAYAALTLHSAAVQSSDGGWGVNMATIGHVQVGIG